MRQNAGLLNQHVSSIKYAHLQEDISEYRFVVSKPVSRLGCVAQGC
jgi:hypothetical protein